MENVTPQQLGFILLLALIAIAVQTLWAWREPVIAQLRRWLPVRSTLGPVARYADEWDVAYPSPGVGEVSRVSPRDYVTSIAGGGAETATDPGLSAGLSAPSGLSAVQTGAVNAYMLDRTRANLVRLAVALGASTSELRNCLRGDNGANGAEIDAARAALGLEPEAPPARAIPVGRDGHFVEV